MFNAESARVVSRAMSERTTRERAGRRTVARERPRRVRQLLEGGIRMMSRASGRRQARRRVPSA